MQSILSIFGKLWQLTAHPTAEQRRALGEGRPFYIVMSLLLTAVSIFIITNNPTLHVPGRLILFVGMMILHIGLHWLTPHILPGSLGMMAYLAVQAVLAFALVLTANEPALAMALFAAMMGETIGSHGLTKRVTAVVVGYLALMIGSIYLIGGQETLASWIPLIIPTIILLIIFMVLFRRQLVAREQSQAVLAELKIAHNQLTDYALQVEALTLATERQRMARELHDTLAQGVAGLVLQLEAANNHLENGRFPRAQTIVQQSMKRARITLADARAAIDDLRLNKRPLAENIQRHSDRFAQATGIPCHLTLNVTAVSPAISDHAERIINESLTNITRHAQADNMWLTVTQSTEQLRIEVRDDGVGFDVETAVHAGHYGLLGMRERTRLLKGRFEIVSEVGEGTHLSVTLPLDNPI